jgi:hypothetical protein
MPELGEMEEEWNTVDIGTLRTLHPKREKATHPRWSEVYFQSKCHREGRR